METDPARTNPAHAFVLNQPFFLVLGAKLTLRLPGDLRTIHAFVAHPADGRRTLTVNVASNDPAADAIINYLHRGDLYAAQAMTEWVDKAEERLYYKRSNAYAAAVGAYLLLRLRLFDRLHNWPMNLADWFEFLPDGCVISAWLLINTQPSETARIRRYLLMGAERGLPIYTEGLRLLMDGLRLLGDDGHAALQTVVERAGFILQGSPVSASIMQVQPLPFGTDSDIACTKVQFGGKHS